jgi:ATPase
LIFVPDTSVIVDGRFSAFMEENAGATVILTEAMLAEVEHQANEGRSLGFAAIEELKKLRKMSDDGLLTIEFYGRRPSEWQIRGAREGEIDDLIRSAALENDAQLVTGDQTQRDISVIKGIKTIYLEHPKKIVRNIEEFFDSITNSVHLKGDMPPIAKKGLPGKVETVQLSYKVGERDIEAIASNLVKRARMEQGSYLESDMNGATVMQLRNLRVVITRPPFSDSVEITAVRPIKKTTIEDYTLADELKTRILSRSSGVLIAGAPGAGKSTFVQALAEWISANGKIVKTMENPRDLQVSNNITQYTALEGSMEKTGNILLLVRTDYTIFDEMRVTSDFHVYVDMRLAGVGMIGVVHATRPIDALQRFIGRIDLGLIPQVVDTVIYVENGNVTSVLVTESRVKVPTGMSQEDLARPVIVVSDYYTGKDMFEIYSFGEQVFAVPIEAAEKVESTVSRYAKRELAEEIRKRTGIQDISIDHLDDHRMVISAPEDTIARIIGRGGSRITELEKQLGLKIDVEASDKPQERKIPKIDIRNRIVYIDTGIPGSDTRIFVDGVLTLQAKTSSKGIIRARISTETGSAIYSALKSGRRIEFSAERSEKE